MSRNYAKSIHSLYERNKFFEFSAVKHGLLPRSPNRREKYLYLRNTVHDNLLIFFSIVSFVDISISSFNFIKNNTLMWFLFPYFVLTLIYFLISLYSYIYSQSFNLHQHKQIVSTWQHLLHASVDIFLPTAGEPLSVLENTWNGVKEIMANYTGKVMVYCLDDAAREEVKDLAQKMDFVYVVRPNRGEFKKAGNLRHGFTISQSDFIVIFDADFRPRNDFLHELLPYFYENERVGIVQSPQYFAVDSQQNWLERGAGAVQEFFYRYSQVSRQNSDASICVGSNAIYRRAALDEIGGTALIEHSEDVHTGFNLRMKGWTIQYVPVILAKGLCPADMKAFFKQQYRWCLGSMSLLTSKKFWKTHLTLKARLSYFSGFLYYIHTGVSSFFVPIIPLAVLLFYQKQMNWQNYILLLPSLVLVHVLYPLWHKATYGIEAWSTRSVYGWAHLFAVVDTISGKSMSWQPTGTKMGKDYRYTTFRILQVICNFIPAVFWVGLSTWKVIQGKFIFLPLLLGGMYYFLIHAKITFYKSVQS